jgi:hypothetical protein
MFLCAAASRPDQTVTYFYLHDGGKLARRNMKLTAHLCRVSETRKHVNQVIVVFLRHNAQVTPHSHIYVYTYISAGIAQSV